ncbi:MAG: cysteine synthase A [Clostridiales bacterium 43-6]|nr:MAG: cysteine synthase A [Clostridiales bacterium 43-6]
MIADNLTDLIGNTPMLRLNSFRLALGLHGIITAKLEYLNPLSSVKDRVGYALIKDAEDKGLIQKGSVIIEPTSGNTGIGLASVCAAKGYRLILTMPDTMSTERKSLLEALGAEIILTDGDKAMNGAIEKANELLSQIPGSYTPHQFENPANPLIHKMTTAKEILRDTAGNIDYFIAGVGTGGTITGVGEALKEHNPAIKIIAVEPFDSPVLSGGKPGLHKLQGLGAGFVPKIYNPDIVDDVITVKTVDAYDAVKALAKSEGLLAGISSGAALSAAASLAKKKRNLNKQIVVLFPDAGERYLSTDLFG